MSRASEAVVLNSSQNSWNGLEVPFYPTDRRRSVTSACAAMMLQAADSRVEKHISDGPFWHALTGVIPDSNRATTGGRTLLSAFQRGLYVEVVTPLDLEGFVEFGPTVLPLAMKKRFTKQHPGVLETERAVTGLLLGNLRSQGTYNYRDVKVNDLGSCVDNGMVARLEFNGRPLTGRSGYMPHSLVILGMTNQGFVAHNPGGNGIAPMAEQEFSYGEVEDILAEDPYVALHAIGSVRRSQMPLSGTVIS